MEILGKGESELEMKDDTGRHPSATLHHTKGVRSVPLGVAFDTSLSDGNNTVVY